MTLIGRILEDRYHVDGLLGHGNTGEVYAGRDMRLDRAVAIKVLTGGDAPTRARFMAEARAMALLNHPHIVAIYDFGEIDGLAYIVMEFVEGKMLRDALDAHELSLPRLQAVFCAVFEALEAAHACSLIHRDMKPANILLGKNGDVKVTDFGLARRMSDVSNTKDSSEVAGTIAYLPPECFLGKSMDARGDLYSVGILMYEAFTGSLPFEKQANDAVAMIFSHVNDVPVPPRALNLQIPTPLERLILKLLAKQPDDRYDSARTVRDVLAQIDLTPADIPEQGGRRSHHSDEATDAELDPSIRSLLNRMLSPQRTAKEAFGHVVSAMLFTNRRQYHEAVEQYIKATEEFRAIKNDPEFIKGAIRLGEVLLMIAADPNAVFDIALVKRARVFLAEAGNIAYTRGLRAEFERCERVANSLETAQIRRG